MSVFSARLGTKKIPLGGSQRGDVPPSVLGGSKGALAPSPVGKFWAHTNSPNGLKVSCDARFLKSGKFLALTLVTDF